MTTTSPIVASLPAAAPFPAVTQRTIFIIEDDPLMAECFARAVAQPDATPAVSRPDVTPAVSQPDVAPVVQIFPDAVQAISALSDTLPDLVLLDVLLNGPDGFTFLNEMISYSDTAKIPVIIITSLDLADKNLAHYGVRAVLSKDTITPAILQNAVRAALDPSSNADDLSPRPSSRPPTATPNAISPEGPGHAR